MLRFQKPELPILADVQRYYSLSQEAGWFSNYGPCVQLLEERCSAYLGLDRPGVSVHNATSGLMVALRAALGDPRPERPYVVVPSFTFVASVTAIVWAGWKPLFVDVDPFDWQVSLDAVRQLESRQDEIAGVMLCSTFGTCPTPERRVAQEGLLKGLGVPVVVDSAAGFGSTDLTGRALGEQGDIEVFSFHATKPFAIGEGGLLTSTSDVVLGRARELANFGFDESRNLPGLIGVNAKLPELSAAVGLVVLERFQDVLEHRRRAAAWLLEELCPHGVARQEGNASSSFQFIPILMPDAASRERVLRQAADAGVEVKVYFAPPMHRVPAFKQFSTFGSLAVTEDLVQRIVCLPMSNNIEARELDLVRSLVLSALGK